MTHNTKYALTQVLILIVLSCLTASWLLAINYKLYKTYD